MAIISKEDAVQWYAQNRGLYKKLSQKIHNIILELFEEGGITVHAVTSRAKEVDSFKNKIDHPKYDDPLNQITDFSGIRIIAYVEGDIKIICKVIEETFDIDSQNSTDKAADLGIDKVGYKSIHYIAKLKADRLNLPEYKKFKNLKFEIQVRTILQHAWAEIEHDRNYKFNGVLPSEIRRRFKILAGSLELMDREFNSISSEIDNIAKNVTIADKKDDLKDVEINSTTLKSYLHTHFKRIIDLNIINPTFNKKDVQIIGELSKFGIKTLNDLRETIPIDFEETIIENHKQFGLQTNYLGILRNMMIIKDPDKYFTKAWAKDWNGIGARTQNLLENYIDFEKIKTKYFSKS